MDFNDKVPPHRPRPTGLKTSVYLEKQNFLISIAVVRDTVSIGVRGNTLYSSMTVTFLPSVLFLLESISLKAPGIEIFWGGQGPEFLS